ncbi:hypothetical protein GCM10011579_084310 [Streptomyces albiflavescens]|uniref:Uncharacterized protein n=1 Tax=Streptomyces albiflavescens TaxID=1623582 RepID=A0A917YDJ9_9ACTN|nr:hypothetical protein GCM10011579_084310 [Streptomyces albiflavescens]
MTKPSGPPTDGSGPTWAAYMPKTASPRARSMPISRPVDGVRETGELAPTSVADAGDKGDTEDKDAGALCVTFFRVAQSQAAAHPSHG